MRERDVIQQLELAIGDLLPMKGARFRFEQSEGSGVDLIVDVSFQDLAFSLVMDISVGSSGLERRIASLIDVVQPSNDAVPVLVAPYFSAKQRALCRQEGVCYLDLSGNAYIQYKSLYIERMGFPNRFPVQRHGRSPFSDKASLILRVMLESDGKGWGVREVAEKAGLNPGFVSRIVKELDERGYVKWYQGKLRLRSWEAALDDWSRFYSYRKNKMEGYFCLAGNVEDILDRIRASDLPHQAYALSVQAGANVLASHSQYREVHLYVRDAESQLMVERSLDLAAVDEGANLYIMSPYYRHSAFYGSQVVKGLHIVSPIQLYLDVYHYKLRGFEQAEYLMQQRIRPAMEASHEAESVV